MARQFNPTKKITQVVYGSNEAKPTRKMATFAQHLTESEVERLMLFEKKTPRRLIYGFEHKFN